LWLKVLKDRRSCVIGIGLDNLDTPRSGCTTHATVYLIDALKQLFPDLSLLDLPYLVRLNPSIPWKTRGNGAVAIHISLPNISCNEIAGDLENALTKFIDNYIKYFQDGKNNHERGAAIVTLNRRSIGLFRRIYERALTDFVYHGVVLEKLRRESNIIVIARSEKAVVGAAAALGWNPDIDPWTYELLVYRSTRNLGRERCIDVNSVTDFDRRHPYTLNNIDYENKRILITPHGDDPVLYGIRGLTPEVIDAIHSIKVCEDVAAYAVFKSNQLTNPHLIPRAISELKPYRTGLVFGWISSKPRTIPGGHVILTLSDFSGSISAVFYSKTKLNRIAALLDVGDTVIVGGSVKHWDKEWVLQAELIIVLHTSIKSKCLSPTCPRCGRTMIKVGSLKGYKCTDCGYTSTLEPKRCIDKPLSIVGLYVPPPSALKHLSKPIRMYALEYLLAKADRGTLSPENAVKIFEPLRFL